MLYQLSYAPGPRPIVDVPFRHHPAMTDQPLDDREDAEAGPIDDPGDEEESDEEPDE